MSLRNLNKRKDIHDKINIDKPFLLHFGLDKEGRKGFEGFGMVFEIVWMGLWT